MPESDHEPSDVDGPLFKATLDRAGDIDDAQPGGERRRAVLRFIPTALVALAEEWLRHGAMFAAGILSAAVILGGVTSDGLGLGVMLVAAGVGGFVMSLVPPIRRWSLGWQWLVFLAICVVQVSLLLTT